MRCCTGYCCYWWPWWRPWPTQPTPSATIYAQVESSETQPVGTTQTKVTIDAISGSNGVTVEDDELTVSEVGLYFVSFAPHVNKDSGDPELFSAWIRLNDTNVPYSGVSMNVTNDTKDSIVTQRLIQLSAGDVISFYVSSDGVNCSLAASGTVPSHISSIRRVGV